MLVSEARRTTALPSRWSRFLIGEKCSISSIGRAPTTMSASPARIGWISLGMSAALYWLSASVFTTMSAPSFSAASSPAWKAAARPLLLVSRTMWSTPLRARDVHRTVGGAVVDHEPLDRVDARHLARQFGESRGQLVLLVPAGNLDDQLHREKVIRLASDQAVGGSY